MLNINKIESLINKEESNASIVSKNTGINYQTLKSKLKSGFWSAEEVEILADYFKKPITYFFDKEESNLANESSAVYGRCLECERKQKEIDKIREERDDIYRRYVECLEELCGKKGNSVKNSA